MNTINPIQYNNIRIDVINDSMIIISFTMKNSQVYKWRIGKIYKISLYENKEKNIYALGCEQVNIDKYVQSNDKKEIKQLFTDYNICYNQFINNVNNLQYVNELTNKLCTIAFNTNMSNINSIYERANENNKCAIDFLKNLSYLPFAESVIAFSINIDLLPYISKQHKTPKFFKLACKLNPEIIKFIADPTFDECVSAVRHQKILIRYVPKEHREFFVLQDPSIILFITNISYTECLHYVKHHKISLQHIPNYIYHESEEIYLAALHNNIDESKFIKNKVFLSYLRYLICHQQTLDLQTFIITIVNSNKLNDDVERIIGSYISGYNITFNLKQQYDMLKQKELDYINQEKAEAKEED